MQKLNALGNESKNINTNQVVEVQFPSGGKNYSYIGSGNLRTGQNIKDAPVTHPKSGKNYIAHNVKVVATHNVAGAEVGDKVGVSNGNIKTIPTGLKYLPGNREYNQNRDIDIKGKKMTVNDYMDNFSGNRMQKLNLMGEIGGKNA